MNGSEELLTRSQKAIKIYNLDRKNTIEQAQRLLSAFGSSNLKELFKESKLENINRSLRLIARYKEEHLHHYDIFRKAGFAADENNFSDAIASILNPRESHQLGLEPIIQLLNQLSDHNPEKINTFKKLVSECQSVVAVHRERHEGNTIPDIEIVCANFIIFIENKVEGGAETFINGDWQTDREWIALLNRCQCLNIPEERILAIFLTPEGKIPKSTHFIPLSVSKLITAFNEAIILANPESKHSLLAFLDYYNWE